MLTHEEVIMTQALGVDQSFGSHYESNSVFFQHFCLKCCLFIYLFYIHETYPHSSALEKIIIHEARIKYYCLQTDILFFLFDVLCVQIFI